MWRQQLLSQSCEEHETKLLGIGQQFRVIFVNGAKPRWCIMPEALDEIRGKTCLMNYLGHVETFYTVGSVKSLASSTCLPPCNIPSQGLNNSQLISRSQGIGSGSVAGRVPALAIALQ